ncbi:MAG: 6,7-dimethyl-8-ribityllumazine synthase [Actinobacteria bacterium]|nr:MAG: 6,7-dimethyl-8-ribityllumazine synthase [Actinomycetota bacterium]
MAGSKKTPEAPLDASGLRIAIVVAEFNARITERLLEGARECLAKDGVPDEAVVVVRVPGSFELPLAAQILAGRGVDAIVALGCVVRGDTPHFEYVSQAATYGLQRVALDTGVPVAFGVLTTEDFAQAEARAGGAEGNKGSDAAQTAIEMALLLRSTKS